MYVGAVVYACVCACTCVCVCFQLNAWDRRQIEEPDYDSRFEGYLEAKEMLAAPPDSEERSWTLTRVDLVLPILHNALYSLEVRK